MGASDSKLVFKQGIFRLSEERHIPADDPYWTSFWELPESSEDIFSLFAPADIRRTRDKALENLETLILALTSRLFILRHHPSFPDPEIAPERDALNCVRVLTRILPFIYEADNLQSWEERFFWGARRKKTRSAALQNEVLFDGGLESPRLPRTDTEAFEDAKPLAEELIDTLVDLLFFSDLTLPRQANGRPKVTYAIWQSGVGCNTSVTTTKEYESNRSEILRLLLTMTSQSMYMTPNALPQKGVRALTHLCTCPDKQVVLSVLCSLLNTTLKYNPATWRVPYNTLVFKDEKQILVTYTLQLLLVFLLYPIPEQDGNASKNYYRHFLGRLHRPQDFQFIVDGMTRILNQPLQEKSSYIPSGQAQAKFASEIIMLFWEITQCNKRFRSFIIDTERVHDFIILTLFYALEYKNDPSKQGVVRMCAFLLQTLSVEKNFGTNLNRTFERQDSLPLSIRIPGFCGTYADFLIHSIYNLITTSQGRLTAIYPALLAVINNIAAYLEGLSPAAASKLMQLFSSMSSPSFLLANDSNHDLLRSLLESINSIVEHQYQKNPELIYAILRNKKRIEALRTFTLESGQEEIERRNRRRKEAAANGDGLEPSSVRSSAESIRSPTSSHPRQPTLSDVPEEDGTFAIGDDEDDSEDEDHRPTPAQSTTSENPSVASSQASAVEDAVPVQLRGMSEKARGKMPAGMSNFSRQNSTTSLGGYSASGQSQSGAFEPTAHWIESWLPELPLHTILTVIQQVSALLPRQAVAGESASREALQKIQEIRLVGVDPSPPRVHSFEWSQLALGWYESLLWGFIFSSEIQVSKGTVGIWNGTAIKLFRVQETAPQGPSLTSPRGAVDAVGSNIVSRIGAMNLRGGPAGAGAAGAPTQRPS
ncbi:Protein HID1 [Colletotrichum musicola]|uniref:Protein HID1 n=1 Tax=Colletotrichum musicola TaxID=2175873 RepID=A0A8H6NZ97_9PEZI|nr:Protein HID1 [Colletotrichum musicola]